MITWIVDTYMDDLRGLTPGTLSMSDVIRGLGYPLVETKYIPLSDHGSVEGFAPDALACGYGTIGFLRQLREKYPDLRPGGFFERPEFSVVYSETRYPRLMLNAANRIDDEDSFPIGEMDERLPVLIEDWGPLFVRPNGVGKAFSGTLVGTERYSVHDFLGYVGAYFGDYLDDRYKGEFVHVRKPVDILGEYRFVCKRGAVISASQYRYQNVHDVRIDVHPAALALAEKFVVDHNGPDLVYVMDITVLHDESAKIIEFNNFSNSGLYACDRTKIVEEVSQVCSEMYA